MLIYDKSSLIWAAQLPDVPAAICRSNLDCLAGAIVTLDEHGKVSVSYLGSEPQMFQVPPLNLQKMNFERTQKELIELEKEIKAGIDFSDVAHINASAERDLTIEFEIGKSLEPLKFPSRSGAAAEDMKMILLNATLKANVNLDQVQIQFHAHYPLKCSKEVVSFESLDAGKSIHVDAWAYVDSNADLVSASISVLVSFINRQSIPRVIEKRQSLPMNMFYRLHQPQKDSLNKFTISVDGIAVPSLAQLFDADFQFENDMQTAAGFHLIHNGKVVTIVAAKNSNRFRYINQNSLKENCLNKTYFSDCRIQSDSLSSINAILEAFIGRLNAFGKKNDFKKKMRIIAAPQLPTANLIDLVEKHMAAHSDLEAIRVRKQCLM